jgi:hypothetical protein
MTTRSSWQPLDLSRLTERIEEARDLLQQAAAVAAAQDGARLAAVAELHRRQGEERRADPHRRRYR